MIYTVTLNPAPDKTAEYETIAELMKKVGMIKVRYDWLMAREY